MRRYLLRGAWLTALYLVGGLILGVGLGLILSPFPQSGPVRHTLSAAVALLVVSAAGAGWGRAMGRLAGALDARRMAWAGALGFGPPLLVAGVTLGQLEPFAVGRLAQLGLEVHVVFTLMFVPAAFLVAAAGGLSLGIGLRDAAFGRALAIGTGLAAAAAFLAVDLFMDAIGWRVGAPEAAKRATMLTVTGVGSLAAALAAGAYLGSALGRRAQRADPRPPAEEVT